MVCKRVHFSGRVQGVGFRYTACRLAEGLNVAGQVRNLPDGRVELIAEGPPADVDRLIELIQREMGDYIAAVAASDLPAEGRFTDFRIAY